MQDSRFIPMSITRLETRLSSTGQSSLEIVRRYLNMAGHLRKQRVSERKEGNDLQTTVSTDRELQPTTAARVWGRTLKKKKRSQLSCVLEHGGRQVGRHSTLIPRLKEQRGPAWLGELSRVDRAGDWGTRKRKNKGAATGNERS